MSAVNVSVETLRLELKAFACGTLRTELEEALQASWKLQDASTAQPARRTLISGTTKLKQQSLVMSRPKDMFVPPPTPKGSVFVAHDAETKSPVPLRIGGSIIDADATESQAETPEERRVSAAEEAFQTRPSRISFAQEPLVPYGATMSQEWVSRHPTLNSTGRTSSISSTRCRNSGSPTSRPKLKRQTKTNWFDESMKLQTGPEANSAASSSKRNLVPGRLRKIVHSSYFEYIALAIISLNVIVIGVETQLKVTQRTNTLPEAFLVVDVLFLTFFAIEVGLKVTLDYRSYFLGPGFAFNWLDCIIVLWEICMNASHGARNLRLLRTTKFIRIMRSARLIRVVESVRTIVWSIGNCFKPFLGGIVVLTFLSYSMAVFFTESVLPMRLSPSPKATALDVHFSCLFTCMLHMFQALTGGIDWNEMVLPLMEHVSPLLGLVYALYIMFALLAVMNVITGVFVSTAMKAAKDDQDKMGIAFLEDLFDEMDERKTGLVGWEDFQKHLNTLQMQELFKSIDLDPSEADCVFKLLDLDGSGELQFSEFLSGCLRLRGPAKALDLLLLLRETTQQFQRQTELVQDSNKLQEQQFEETAKLLQGFAASTAPTTKRKSKAGKVVRAE